ncbi:nitrogen fixation protein NifR [Staphylococcus aureus]|nr:nitrogen fixation protein NifR [Staphylococcus aureus]
MTERKCTCNNLFSIKVWGPNIEAGGKSAYNNVQVGVGPNIENFEMKFYRQCKLAGPQHREIGFPISTGNASWGGTTK